MLKIKWPKNGFSVKKILDLLLQLTERKIAIIRCVGKNIMIEKTTAMEM